MDYRDQLLARRAKLEQVINEKQARLSTPISETTDELSIYDQHPADIGTEVFEREKDLGMLEIMEFEKEKIDNALARYEQGLYGVCENCGKRIDPARLSRVVNTTLCIECARNRENRYNYNNDTISNGILSISSLPDKGEAFQVAGYEFYEE